jgi:oxygen-independent coproporphyrinogen III oxidase
MMRLDAVDRRLLERYGTEAFMYVEYPHKRFWARRDDDSDYLRALEAQFSRPGAGDCMLYVHIPFCHKQCLFCTCHVDITLSYDRVRRYLDYLHRDIDLLASFFDRIGASANFREIHLGGGSPTYLKQLEFDRLTTKLGGIADIEALDEFAIEIDPRRVKPAAMPFFREQGINRVSFGIQDFDLAVQRAVDRVQPVSLIERLLTPDVRGLFPNGVNFDILIGLPHQTRETFVVTMKQVVDLAPDRVCMNYMHMSPKFHPHQLKMPAAEIPDQYLKKELFLEGAEMLEAGGYVRAGYDHFVRHTDAVADAQTAGKMVWNRLGVSAGRYDSTIGVGVSSTSTIGDRFYAQNHFELGNYYTSIDKGQLPIGLFVALDDEDRLRRTVIQGLRTYFHVDWASVESEFGIEFSGHFAREIEELDDYVRNGLIEVGDSALTITPIGEQFANLIASTFDSWLRADRERESA